MRQNNSSVYVVLGIVALFLIAVYLGCRVPNPTPNPAPPDGPVALTPVLSQMMSDHNKERRSVGVADLQINSLLTSTAQNHAQWMANNETMSHVGEGGKGFWERFAGQGQGWVGGGENIARASTAETAMRLWLGSVGHRNNILNRHWTHIGLGEATSVTGKRYWCVTFGTKVLSANAAEELSHDKTFPAPLAEDPL